MSKVLVPWSGGLDSTFMILELLNEGHKVHAYYIDVNRGSAQNKREQAAIEKIIPFFEPYSFTYHGIGVSIDMHVCGNQILAYQFLWPLLLMANGDYDMIAIGYVMNDDAISFLNELETLMNGYKPFVKKMPKLYTPLTKFPKQYIWNNLREDIRKHVTWCETDKNLKNPCRKCASCKRMNDIK